MSWKLDEIRPATGGTLVQAGEQNLLREIVTDSTKVTKGSIFVALKGERMDGHRFMLIDALTRGAACVIVHQNSARRCRPRHGRASARHADGVGDLAHYRQR